MSAAISATKPLVDVLIRTFRTIGIVGWGTGATPPSHYRYAGSTGSDLTRSRSVCQNPAFVPSR